MGPIDKESSVFRDPEKASSVSPPQNAGGKMTSTGADVHISGDGETESGFREAVMGTIDGILVVDNDGRVHFANPSAETLLGWPADQ